MSNIWYFDTDYFNIMKPKYFTALKQPDFAHEVKNLLILLTNKKKLSYELSQSLYTTLYMNYAYIKLHKNQLIANFAGRK